MLTPGRYVGAADVEDDGITFEERFGGLRATLSKQFELGRSLEERIEAALNLVSADA